MDMSRPGGRWFSESLVSGSSGSPGFEGKCEGEFGEDAWRMTRVAIESHPTTGTSLSRARARDCM
jgi:hypothetical protein